MYETKMNTTRRIKIKKSDKEIIASPYIVTLNVRIEEVLQKTKRLDGLDSIPNTGHDLAIVSFLDNIRDQLAFKTPSGRAYQIIRTYHQGDFFQSHIYNITPMVFDITDNKFYPIQDSSESESVFFINDNNDILVYAELLDGTQHSILDVLVETGMAFTSENKVFIREQKKEGAPNENKIRSDKQ